MSLAVVLTKEAETEFDEAVDWYEERAELGAVFIARVRNVLNRIGETPERYPIVFRGIRRALIRRTPYAVHYRILADQVEVIAIYHGSRDPSGWKGRV